MRYLRVYIVVCAVLFAAVFFVMPYALSYLEGQRSASRGPAWTRSPAAPGRTVNNAGGTASPVAVSAPSAQPSDDSDAVGGASDECVQNSPVRVILLPRAEPIEGGPAGDSPDKTLSEAIAEKVAAELLEAKAARERRKQLDESQVQWEEVEDLEDQQWRARRAAAFGSKGRQSTSSSKRSLPPGSSYSSSAQSRSSVSPVRTSPSGVSVSPVQVSPPRAAQPSRPTPPPASPCPPPKSVKQNPGGG